MGIDSLGGAAVVVVVVDSVEEIIDSVVSTESLSLLDVRGSSLFWAVFPNLNGDLFLREKSGLGLNGNPPAPPLIGKLGKFLLEDLKFFKFVLSSFVSSCKIGEGVVVSSSDPINILFDTVELMKNSCSGSKIFCGFSGPRSI